MKYINYHEKKMDRKSKGLKHTKGVKWKKPQLRKTALVLSLIIIAAELQTVSASRINDANNKKNEAQEALDAANNDISKIENAQAALQGEIDALDTDLVNVIMNLSILEGDLDTAHVRLEEVQADLKQAQENEEEQYAAMKKRIRFMYERGDTAFITSIFESNSMADLLNRVEYVNEVYDYDRNLLIQYQTTKQQVAELETQVEGEIAEMEELQANYQEEQRRYETMIAEKQSQMSDFDGQLAEAKHLAAQYQETIKEQNEIIRQEEERQRQAEEERQRQEAAAAAAAAAANRNPGVNSNSGSSGGSTGGGSSSGGNLNPGYATSVSGSEVVNYATKFIGNPYVWGGTDPNTGADCSGFVQYVFRQFGVSLPRDSYSQRSAGKEVSYSNAQPGDLICYSGHVAIYMGNGQIVHASSSAPYPVGGIKTGTATYRTIVSVRRVL